MLKFENERCCFEHKIDNKKFSNLKRHMHDRFELLYIISGKGVFNLDGNVYNVGPCDLIITPLFCYHFIETDENVVYNRFVFNFTTDYFENDYSSIFKEPKIVNLATQRDLLEMIDRFLKCENSNYSENDFNKMINLLLEEFLIQLKNTHLDEHVSKSLTILTSKTIAFINEHIFENFNLDDIANNLCVSKSHLQNTFIKTMRIGIKSFIIMKKMERARVLLKEGKRTQEVADLLGYRTYSSFYKSYLKTFGESPKNTF